MSYQINLRPPEVVALSVPWSMRQVVRLFMVVCVPLLLVMTAWLWELNAQTLAALAQAQAQQQAVNGLQQQLGMNEADAGLVNVLQARRTEQSRLQNQLQELQRGLLVQGAGHSARLSLLAKTIPASVWLTQVKLDTHTFELTGATLEPAALHTWLETLAAEPLLKNQNLNAIKLERISANSPLAARTGIAPIWQFTLSAKGGA